MEPITRGQGRATEQAAFPLTLDYRGWMVYVVATHPYQGALWLTLVTVFAWSDGQLALRGKILLALACLALLVYSRRTALRLPTRIVLYDDYCELYRLHGAPTLVHLDSVLHVRQAHVFILHLSIVWTMVEYCGDSGYNWFFVHKRLPGYAKLMARIAACRPAREPADGATA